MFLNEVFIRQWKKKIKTHLTPYENEIGALFIITQLFIIKITIQT